MGLLLYITQLHISKSHCASQTGEGTAVPGRLRHGWGWAALPDWRWRGTQMETELALGWDLPEFKSCDFTILGGWCLRV